MDVSVSRVVGDSFTTALKKPPFHSGSGNPVGPYLLDSVYQCGHHNCPGLWTSNRIKQGESYEPIVDI